jgi:phosphonoacetate hydrolase
MKEILGVLMFFFLICNGQMVATGTAAERKPIEPIIVHGQSYHWPAQPVVIVCLDGGDPEYFKEAFARDLLPNIRKIMNEGYVSIAEGVMPSFTNPNNMSIVTGTPPSVHGISGNYFLNPETGKEVMMNEPEFLRTESILAAFSQRGAKVVVITAKDKLRKMLGHQVKGGIKFSSEKADKCTTEENGLDNCLEYVGRPLPNVYSADLSLFVMEAGIKILEKERPDIIYLSLTDYIQHKYAPGSKEANDFYQALDDTVGRLAKAGAVIGITGDHGMNDKSNPDGSPNVIYLQDILDGRFGTGKTKVILPITDPYVVHHGALGSFATVFSRGQTVSPSEIINMIKVLPGVEQVMDRESAVKMYELPGDRIGDLIVIGDKGSVIGTSKANHDLSQLKGMRLRSHGGLADRKVPFIISRPLKSEYTAIAGSRTLRNYDIFDFVLNGVNHQQSHY